MKKNTGVKRLIKATGYSFKGLVYAFKNEEAFRLEVVASVILMPLAICLDVTTLERVVLIACLFLVLIAELINSAIEAIVDRISLEHHILSGAAKDTGSAAVLLALILCGIVWGSILMNSLVESV